MRKPGKSSYITLLAVLSFLFAHAPSFAQQSNSGLAREIDELSDDLKKMERSLKDVEREVYSQQRRSSKRGSSDATVDPAQYSVRIDELETIIREMNGELEQLRFTAEQLKQQQENMSGDLEFRLQAIEQKLGLSLSGAGGTYVPQTTGGSGPSASSSAEVTQSVTPSQIGNQVDPQTVPTVQGLGQAEQVEVGRRVENSTVTQSTPGSGPQSLGTLSADQLPGTSAELYSHARNKILQQDFAGAQQALEKFITEHGDDELAGAAQYWLGESFYAQGSFRESGQAFAKVLSDHPKSDKAPDSLLKLGMSLSALGETKAACNSFKEMSTRFPDASGVIARRLEVERSKAGC